MIPINELQLDFELISELDEFNQQVHEFRRAGPLDPVALAKLEEHFKASHIYHSTGIEGNRLTLQETNLVLKEGIDISGKPLQDSIEVRSLGEAFDYLKQISEQNQTVREIDIRDIHGLLMRGQEEYSPGEYRKIGVIISGSEHRPPEPIEVPSLMEKLIDWINQSMDSNAIIVATLAHHQIAAIHPFKDGNGRVSRLLMNLILLKHGYPICNISRDSRPAYYDALGLADKGNYEPLIRLIFQGSAQLFQEYQRIRRETQRMQEWAGRWGSKEEEILLRRETREMDLWKTRIKQVFLEFEKATELLDEKLERFILTFFNYQRDISFDDYQNFTKSGTFNRNNGFSIEFFEKSSHRSEKFIFRYFRDYDKFTFVPNILPLQLSYKTEHGYVKLSQLEWAKIIRLREIYFNNQGQFVIRYFDAPSNSEQTVENLTIGDAVEWFFDDVLRNVFHLRA
ncbi:MAG: Fic family protein [Herpetosiphon sp.]|nr:Fic family protein [Herpetosiphon sp.]